MRLKDIKTDIDYSETKKFFCKRAQKFKEDNPYSVTMYQDNNKELVEQRNLKEIQKLVPLLNLNRDTRVLDIACGIGRWADAVGDDVDSYCGLDFSEELIQIARKRNRKENCSFYVGGANEIGKVLSKNCCGEYDVILLIGILMYLNDSDLYSALDQIRNVCNSHAVICIREPISVEERLTLKAFYSEELGDNYSAIYRTRAEFMDIFEKTLLAEDFVIKEENFLFENEELNNRKETVQYYFIFERYC